jgi:AhpD family alkylhydroperoxidase
MVMGFGQELERGKELGCRMNDPVNDSTADAMTPEPHAGWPSYTMVEDRMRKIYFEFYQETYKKSKIDRKTKELIAIAASLGFKCQGCLNGHIKKAKKFGATPEEISEAIAITMGVAAASVVDLTDIAAESLQIKHFE